jgi:glycosyltransferase involved in cell wall biosynthesis
VKVLLFANTEWYLFNFRLSLFEALRDSGHEVVLVSPPGSYGEQLVNHGFQWIPAPMDRMSLNPLREVRLLLWLIRLVKREKVDLVHSFTVKCAVYGSLAARLSGGKARVGAVAGLGYVFSSKDVKARLLRPIVRLMLRLSLEGKKSRLILQNPDDVALFEQFGLVAGDAIRLIRGSGVDLTRFKPRDGEREDGPFRVVLPARLLWEKGVGELLAAARLLQSRGRRVEVLLAGKPDLGNPAAVPESDLRAWQDEGVVQWLGQVDDMPALFQSVDAVALPTYYREGLPKSLIEAAACALPLVTTDMPGCREVVTHEVDGLIVPIRDPEALADAICRLMDDPSLCKRLGDAARSKAVAEFDDQIVIKKTLAVYDELLGA